MVINMIDFSITVLENSKILISKSDEKINKILY